MLSTICLTDAVKRNLLRVQVALVFLLPEKGAFVAEITGCCGNEYSPLLCALPLPWLCCA